MINEVIKGKEFKDGKYDDWVRGIKFVGCAFRNVELKTLMECEFYDCIFQECECKKIYECKFEESQALSCIVYSTFNVNVASNSSFISCRLSNTDFKSNKIQDVLISDCRFLSSIIVRNEVHNIKCVNSNLQDSRIINNKIENMTVENNDFSMGFIKSNNLSDLKLSDNNFKFNDIWNNEVNDVKSDGNNLFYDLMCPREGSFIAYDKVRCYLTYYIVKLQILDDSERFSDTNYKCFCSKAKILEIKDLRSGDVVNEIYEEFHDRTYMVNGIVEDSDVNIRFFINEELAKSVDQ